MNTRNRVLGPAGQTCLYTRGRDDPGRTGTIRETTRDLGISRSDARRCRSSSCAGRRFLGLPLPAVPGLVGAFGYVQGALVDPGVPGGFGLTNGAFVTAMPNRTPTRAFFGGQDFSGGAATGQLSVLDLTTIPPSFRATGALGFAGTISNNSHRWRALVEQWHDDDPRLGNRDQQRRPGCRARRAGDHRRRSLRRARPQHDVAGIRTDHHELLDEPRREHLEPSKPRAPGDRDCDRRDRSDCELSVRRHHRSDAAGRLRFRRMAGADAIDDESHAAGTLVHPARFRLVLRDEGRPFAMRSGTTEPGGRKARIRRSDPRRVDACEAL